MSWEGMVYAIVSAALACAGYAIGYRDGRKVHDAD